MLYGSEWQIPHRTPHIGVAHSPNEALMLNALTNLLPTPLHPAVVHMPMALVLLVPAFAAGTLYAIHRGARPMRAWGITTVLLATLSLSAWVSLETGQDQSEKVEEVVAEAAIETHEEAAELFLTLSLIVLGVSTLGLATGKIGSAARAVAAAGIVVLLVAGYRVGRSGGELVYKHGAANAYTQSTAPDSASDVGDAQPARERHDR